MDFTKKKLPSMIITGASGFIGKYLVDLVKDNYVVFAIARRSAKEAHVPFHRNIHWVQWDISNAAMIYEVMGYIIGKGGADYVFHLAAYYDYDYLNKPEYHSTNVAGTRNVLELSKMLKVKRFIFSSSLAACNFPESGGVINEVTKPNADFAYAVSKKMGEDYCKEYSKHIPCTVVRFAAIFTDYCEFAPLYKFLSTWLANQWDSKFIAGKGESAISYLHIQDLTRLLMKIIIKDDYIPRFDVYIASPDGSTSHKELYSVSTRDFFGYSKKPIFIPKTLTYPGLLIKKFLSKLHIIPKLFEQFWMIKYIDLKLEIDSSYTQNILDWQPTPRYDILRRMLFLLVKLKSHPSEWQSKNEAAMKHAAQRPNLIIYEAMIHEKDRILEKITTYMLANENASKFPNYHKMDYDDFQYYLSTLFHLLMASVRSADRSLIIEYIDDIAIQRFAAGFTCKEVNVTLDVFNEIITTSLIHDSKLSKFKQDIYDYLSLSIQVAQDELEEIYESISFNIENTSGYELSLSPEQKKRHEMIIQLSTFYQQNEV